MHRSVADAGTELQMIEHVTTGVIQFRYKRMLMTFNVMELFFID